MEYREPGPPCMRCAPEQITSQTGTARIERRGRTIRKEISGGGVGNKEDRKFVTK